MQAVELDLERFSSMDSLIEQLYSHGIYIDLAILDAGLFGHDDRMTADGYSPLF